MGQQCTRPPLLQVVNCMPGAERLHPLSVLGPAGVASQDPSRGFSIWVDSVDDLVVALSLQADYSSRSQNGRSDLEHLYALPEGGGDAASGTDRARASDRGAARSPVEDIYFPRDVGVCSGRPSASAQGGSFPWGTAAEWRPCHDSYACMQVDDMANPWAFYAVAEGCPPQGWSSVQHQEQAPRLAADIPAMLARHPSLHSNPCRALFETHKAATKVAALGTVYPESNSALSLVLLRDEFLHIAWAGDAKIVLGRLASKAPLPSRKAPEPVTHPAGSALRLASRHRPGVGSKPKEGYVNSQQMKLALQFDGPPPILRAVDLTAESSDSARGPGIAAGDSAGGGGKRRDSPGQANCSPDVRRMKLKPEDVCVIVATQALWKCLSPEEVVTIVGQRLNRMASDAADALVAEVRRRCQPISISSQGGLSEGEEEDELSVLVIYLTGERYVKDFEIERANHLQGDSFVSEGLMPATEPVALQWGCCRGKVQQLDLPGGPAPGM